MPLLRSFWTTVALACPLLLSAADEPATAEDLLEAGRQLWEEHAPEEVKAQYDFPSQEKVNELLAAVQQALAEGSFVTLASYEAEARQTLAVLRQFQGGDALADWLEPRLDFLYAAVLLTTPVRADSIAPRSTPSPSPATPLQRPYWEAVVVRRQPPARAAALVPKLKEIFDAQGIPSALVWIAEVESSMNPNVCSPAGACGLFQFMPATAERFGISSTLLDERTNPEKSARAAAQYLRFLHKRFGSWPLALAAYNAGEGRVGRALKKSGTKTFPDVAPHLPAETRMYVPKVLATVAARESVDPETLPAPALLAAVDQRNSVVE